MKFAWAINIISPIYARANLILFEMFRFLGGFSTFLENLTQVLSYIVLVATYVIDLFYTLWKYILSVGFGFICILCVCVLRG